MAKGSNSYETGLVRHGPTAESRRYTVNGDRSRALSVDLDSETAMKVARVRSMTSETRTFVSSEFLRCVETSDALGAGGRTYVVPDLNEVHYGEFEGGPWTAYGAWLADHGREERPAGAHESWNEAILRVVRGLEAALDLEAPRLIVGHGFWISAVKCALDDPPSLVRPHALAGVPYLEPTLLRDVQVLAAIEILRETCIRRRTVPIGRVRT